MKKLAALNARHNTGCGQKVEVSLYESSLAMLVNVASNYLIADRDGGRFGNGHPSIVPYTTFDTADGMLALAVGSDAQFARCAVVLGHPEWGKDERYMRNRDRVAHRDQVDGMIAQALAVDSADAWIAKLQAAGVPCGRINSVKQALDDPQTAARAMIESIDHPTIGALKMLGTPFKLNATPTSVRRPPPTLGQHTDEILRSELGYDDARIAALRHERVI